MDNPRLPRSDIPPDFKCPYPACDYQGKVEFSFRGHMAQSHGVKYALKPPSETKQKLSQYNKTKEQLQTTEQLLPWHCVALARHVVYGQPFTAVAEEMKHSAETIRAVAKSPAGEAFIAAMTANLKDPVRLVKDLMASDVFSKHMDWMQAWEWAMHAKDYDAIHRMAKDIGMQPALDQQQKVGPTKISLHLNMNDLGTPAGASSFKTVDADFTVEGGGNDEEEDYG